MYAVIASGGKQYRVTQGQVLKIEKLPIEPGKAVEFEQVLMVADGDNIQIGGPFINGMKVTGEVVSQGRGPKIRIIKFRRRKHHMKQMGHRQDLTEVRITAIGGNQGEKKVTKPAAKTAKPAAKKAAKPKAAKKTA